ncbi:MAG: proteasome-activating nucleotidase [Candidatus Woesearchaeota archaeon]
MGDVVFGYTSERSHLEEENALLRETIAHLKEEIDRFKLLPLMVCEIKAVFKESAIIKIPNGNQFLVGISKECKKLSPGDTVLVEQKSLTVLKKVGSPKGFNVEKFVIVERPNVQWKDVGGMEEQINEIREVVELPLKRPELFQKVGIEPPKGILLYGAPGTGKTLLAKAVATSTNATFIQVVGSELVQKFIGEGAKLVKEVFQLAREKAPSIVFIDELDALAAKRVDIGTSGEREVQRTFMQLLSELDGFHPLGNVKVIGCTNRKDILDSAVIRPGRLERMIFVPAPTKEGRKEIFAIHTRNMSLENVDVDKIVGKTEGFTGAEIKAVCTEAGYFAIRSNRTYVKTSDFLLAEEKVRQKEEQEGKEYVTMFG